MTTAALGDGLMGTGMGSKYLNVFLEYKITHLSFLYRLHVKMITR